MPVEEMENANSNLLVTPEERINYSTSVCCHLSIRKSLETFVLRILESNIYTEFYWDRCLLFSPYQSLIWNGYNLCIVFENFLARGIVYWDFPVVEFTFIFMCFFGMAVSLNVRNRDFQSII